MKDKGQEKKRRAFWQARLDDARRQYAEKRERMDRREDCYKGTRHIPAAGGGAAKAAGNVRNIIYELIESQVDASIPQPRVTAVHPEDRRLAKKIEAMLLAQIRQRNFKEMNDEQERTVPIQGGDFWHVEWDPEGGFHCQMGDLSVELRHPKQVIPQPGVYDLEKMDYLFVLVSQSRRALEKRYGVRLPEEGESDVDAVEDQQVAINKYGTKIQEKLLKGGSYVTLPQGVNIETTDRELKIIRLKNPADKALISVLNIQPDTSRDQQMLEVNYSWAKSTLGITDAFQGKYDASATSGTAKQFSANQSAGRLQSKREMKNQAYARLYKLMFQFMLAYADEPYPMTLRGPDGTVEYAHFDRYEFLKRDAAGQLYWNDEFLFDVDPASNLAANRETLWTMIDQKYQAGAFGPLGETASLYRLWTLLAETGYPHAEAMKASVGQQLEKEQGGQAQESALPGKGGSAL